MSLMNDVLKELEKRREMPGSMPKFDRLAEPRSRRTRAWWAIALLPLALAAQFVLLRAGGEPAPPPVAARAARAVLEHVPQTFGITLERATARSETPPEVRPEVRARAVPKQVEPRPAPPRPSPQKREQTPAASIKQPTALDRAHDAALEHAANGKLDAAIRLLEDTGVAAPRLAGLLAALLQRKGEHERATQLYAKLLVADSTQAVWWMGFGISLEAQGHSDEAREAFTRALQVPGLAPQARTWTLARVRALGSTQERAGP